RPPTSTLFPYTTLFRSLAEDMEAGMERLVQGGLHDFLGDALDLDVHLQGGDALGGTRHLEVHVAEMVLVAEDVGQYGVAFRVLDKTHGDTGHRRLEGHTGVHQGEAGTAHRGHGAG